MKNLEQSRKSWELYCAGSNPFRLAKYLTRRECDAHAMSWNEDMASDAVATAYARFCRWREEHIPADSGKVIRCAIRWACRTVVQREVRRYAPQTGHDLSACPARECADPVVHDTSRLLRVAGELPAKLATFAVVISGLGRRDEIPSRREMADAVGCSVGTVQNRLASLKASPAVHGMLVARMLDGVCDEI